MIINGFEFTEYHKYNREEKGWTVYIYEFYDNISDEGKRGGSVSYYIGQTHQRVSRRCHQLNSMMYKKWGKTRYSQNSAVNQLLYNGHLKTIWIHSGIETETAARELETATIREFKHRGKHVLNVREYDEPRKSVKSINPDTGEEHIYPSIKSAYRDLGVGTGFYIRQTMNGKRKTANNLRWVKVLG